MGWECPCLKKLINISKLDYSNSPELQNFCKSMQLGTHLHHPNECKFRYSAIADSAFGGVAAVSAILPISLKSEVSFSVWMQVVGDYYRVQNMH